MSEISVAPGQVLAGKYKIDRVLGQGGMGIVVAATHLQLEERVALKFLLPHMASADAVARFIREARAAVRIKSDHVARVSDVGTLENGAPFMVMEYLEGSDLAGALEQRGRLSVDETIDYILQACEALAEAHSYGIVHRDLKPANLFLTRRFDGTGHVKVLDFGISKLLTAPTDSSLTRTGGMLGSPLYMSPEQLTSARHVDARSDIWSLGVIMYELLTGAAPFTAEELPQLCIAILQAEIAPLSRYRADVPPGVEAAVMGCLARDRETRFQTIGALAEALAPFASSRACRSVEEIRAMSGARGTPAPSTHVISSPAISRPSAPTQTLAPLGGTHDTPARPARKPIGIIVAIALVAMLMIGGGVAGMRMLTKSADAPAVPAAQSAAPTPAPVKSAEPNPEPTKEPAKPIAPVAASTSAALAAKPPVAPVVPKAVASAKAQVLKTKSAVDDRL